MADLLRPLQLDDDDDDDDELPPPIPVASQRAAPASSEPVLQDSVSSSPRRFRQRATSWSAPSTLPPPLPPVPPAELALASTPASALLQHSLQALSGGRRTRPAPSDADDAFNQLVAAAAETKAGVGLRVSSGQPAVCAGVIAGQSAALHPQSARFAGSTIVAIDGVEMASKSRDHVCDMLLGAFGSVCELQLEDAQGGAFAVSLLRANAEFFASYEEQVRRIGSMMSPALSAAIQAQNSALQEQVRQLRSQLQEADDRVDRAVRALENAQLSVKMQEESSALSKILEEEEALSEISRLEAIVQQLTREVALKDGVIRRHDLTVLAAQQALGSAEAALRADVAALETKCAALEKQNADAATALSALREESAAKQRSTVSAAALGEILKCLAVFEGQVPKLTASVARLEAELHMEKTFAASTQAALDGALARESSWCDRMQQLEEQLLHATSRSVQSISAARAPPRDRDPVIDCFVGSGNAAWDAAVQRHAVAVVVSSAVERTVARTSARSLLERQPPAGTPSRAATAVITHDVASQSGCSADDVGALAAAVAHDLFCCLRRLGQAAAVAVPPHLCKSTVDALLHALLTGNCCAPALPELEAWCTLAADSARSFELRAVAAEGERDGLLSFRVQLERENARLVDLHQKQQQRQKEVERAMLASVGDVQQLSQQMGSLLAVIKDKSAENSELLRQTARMKQLLTVQSDLRLQIEGQRQQLQQLQLLEREALQLKISRDDAVQRLEQLELELRLSQEAQRHMENDLFKAREMLMDAELRMFTLEEGKARLQSERDSAEATLLAFNFLRSGGVVSAKRVPFSPSNRQPAALPAASDLLAVDIKDSSAAALQQAQELFDSLASVAACSQLFTSALDLCERCIMNASEQGLRMSHELHALTEQSNGLSAAQPAELFVRQLEANSDRAAQIGARMNELMLTMKAQHQDLAARYGTFANQYAVFERAAAEADKGTKHLQWLVKRRLTLLKEGQQVPQRVRFLPSVTVCAALVH